MKKLLGILLLCVVVLSLKAATGVINAKIVNVRKKATTDSLVVGQLVKGTTVEIVRGDNEWLEIKAPLTYVSKSFVGAGSKTTSRVNVRVGAGVEYDALGQLPAGTVVKPKASQSDGDWLSIEAPSSMTVFVSAALVSYQKIDVKDNNIKRPAASDTPDQPFSDLGVVSGSARRAKVTGMLYALPRAVGNLQYAVLTPGTKEYKLAFYVHSVGQARLKYFKNKTVTLTGTSYSVPNWTVRVLKVDKIVAEK